MKFNKENMPKSIAIIMDGNRRWAKAQGKPVSFGHKEGAKTLEKIVRYANKIGLEYITVYAFSTENWKRAEDEVKTLMLLLQAYLDDYAKRADSENIKVKILGDITALSKGMQKSIRECMERTKNNTGVTFNIALNYGGRDEIVSSECGFRGYGFQVQSCIELCYPERNIEWGYSVYDGVSATGRRAGQIQRRTLEKILE